MKFEDSDLANNEKFPHLEIRNLMKQNVEEAVIMLEPWKWLYDVEKVRLLHLLWIPHSTVHPSPFLSSSSCFS